MTISTNACPAKYRHLSPMQEAAARTARTGIPERPGRVPQLPHELTAPKSLENRAAIRDTILQVLANGPLHSTALLRLVGGKEGTLIHVLGELHRDKVVSKSGGGINGNRRAPVEWRLK